MDNSISKDGLRGGKIVAALLSAAVILMIGHGHSQAANWTGTKPDGGFGGIAEIVKDVYLVAQDWKNFGEKDKPRFGIVEKKTSGNHIYTPIATGKLTLNKYDSPRDLESICVLRNEIGDTDRIRKLTVLSAESGDYHHEPSDSHRSEHQDGYIYQIDFIFDLDHLNDAEGEVVGAYDLPQHTLSTGIPEFGGGNFEGLACAENPKVKNEFFVLVSERGGEKARPYQSENTRGRMWWTRINAKDPTNIGGWADVAMPHPSARTMVFDPPGSKDVWSDRGGKRDISSLFICGSKVWAAATIDVGDFGPFGSVVYHLANYAEHLVPPFYLVNDRSGDTEVVGHKVEGLFGALNNSDPKECEFVVVSDDEKKGGVFFALPHSHKVSITDERRLPLKIDSIDAESLSELQKKLTDKGVGTIDIVKTKKDTDPPVPEDHELALSPHVLTLNLFKLLTEHDAQYSYAIRLKEVPNSTGWEANEDQTPPNPPSPTLHVKGKVETNAANIVPQLKEASPQGKNPRILILDLTLENTGQQGAQVVDFRPVVEFQKDVAAGQYSHIHIRWESASIKMLKVKIVQ